MLKKAYSLVTDPRMLHIFPFVLAKRYVSRRKKAEFVKPKKVFVSFTFDVERTPKSGSYDTVSSFMKRIGGTMSGRQSTFFVQGDMVEACTRELRTIQRSNEIGLHGYSHEIWGDEEWWVGKKNRRPLNSEEKGRLLEASLDKFKGSKLYRPRSFRAPYMVVNDDTIHMLEEFGFRVDSSFPSYLGVYPVPMLFERLVELPVTSRTMPKVRFWPLPHSTYDILTARYFLEATKDSLEEFLQDVVHFQVMRGVLPHLVFLMHSWEFATIGKRGYSYCSEKNYDRLEGICELLERVYKVEYVTMSRLARIVRMERGLRNI